MLLGWLEKRGQFKKAAWKVAIMLWTLLLSQRIFSPQLAAFYFSTRENKVVGLWVVEFVRMQLELTNLGKQRQL